MEVPPPLSHHLASGLGPVEGLIVNLYRFKGFVKGLGEGFAEGPCVIIEGVFKQSCTGGLRGFLGH